MPGASEVSPAAGWRTFVVEGAVAFGAMAMFVALCPSIHVNPMLRIGQVSGLASLQLRFIAIALPVIIAAIVTARVRDGRYFALTSRLVCAAFAGLASGFVAGGIIVALRSTPYGLNAHNGDASQLALWANSLSTGHGEIPPPFYPPLFPHALSWYSRFSGLPALYALKDLQIALTAVGGPLAYLCWRSLLRPGWALGIGVIATLVVIEPYKPYEFLSLVTFIPIAISFVRALRHADERTIHQLGKGAVLYGVAFGVQFLCYSGWFKWSAPGLFVAAACVIPWRRGGWKPSVILGAATAMVFVVVAWTYLTDIHTYTQAAGISVVGGDQPMFHDDYVYFDVTVDPAYFAMWKADLPGGLNPFEWPPPAELAGVGVYQLALFLGFGTAIALGRKRTTVIALACVIVSAWLMRFYYAHYLYETKLVQLYPRTSIQLAYCFVVMAGFAVYFVVEHFARRSPAGPLRAPSGFIGAMCGLAFVISVAGSAITDRYMPQNVAPRSMGFLAWAAHEAAIAQEPPDPP